MQRIQKVRIQPGGDAAVSYHIVHKHEGQIIGNPPVKVRYLFIYAAQVTGNSHRMVSADLADADTGCDMAETTFKEMGKKLLQNAASLFA